MKYFREKETGDVYAYESNGSQDDSIKPGLAPMTDDQVSEYLNPRSTADQIAKKNTDTQSELTNSASAAMTPLLLSLQLGDASDDEVESAKEWRAYYQALKSIDLTKESPEWPSKPK